MGDTQDAVVFATSETKLFHVDQECSEFAREIRGISPSARLGAIEPAIAVHHQRFACRSCALHLGIDLEALLPNRRADGPDNRAIPLTHPGAPTGAGTAGYAGLRLLR